MEHGVVFQTSQVHLRIEVRMKLTFELMTFSCYSGFLLYICHLKAKEDTVTLPEDTLQWFLFTVCVSPPSCQSQRRQKEWHTAALEIMWASRNTGGNANVQRSNSWGGKWNLLSTNTVNKHYGWKYVTHTCGQKKKTKAHKTTPWGLKRYIFIY